MILIYQNQSNQVVLTLTEKTTISSPVYYLFSFKNVSTNLTKNFLSTDTSCSTVRYNEFTIVEGTDVDLDNDGQWTYTIYAQNSAVNTDPSNADEVVETGRVLVVDPTASTDQDYTENDNVVDKQYTPE